MDAVNDSRLGATLGFALGITLTLTSTVSRSANTVQMISTVCPQGFWCTAGLRIACEPGFFNPTINANNASACIRCPEHATTLGPNSTQQRDCICDAGYYNDAIESEGVVCAPCMLGTACDESGTTLHDLPLLRGWWRVNHSSRELRRENAPL